MQTIDEKYMDRCFFLAQKGAGSVAPNPMVGAVIVHNNEIIGEGYHKKYGFAHAEVNAFASVKDESLLGDSTIYVSLEPCSHYGKTPPCAELLIKKNIKKCVIANEDPNPKVSGRGIQMLKDAGIEVVCGVSKEKGRFINRRFFCYQEKKRPYIILKIAQSFDGYMDINLKDETDRQNCWITNDMVNVLVHKMRKEEGAFMVGANTVKNDDCRLNTRHYYGRNPIRLVYDRDLSLETSKHFFDDTQRTLIFNNLKTELVGQNTQYIKVERGENYIKEIVDYLYSIGVSSLVVEGGKDTLEKFLKNDLWDEALVFTSNQKFYKGIKTPVIDTQLKASTSRISDNRFDSYYNNDAF